MDTTDHHLPEATKERLEIHPDVIKLGFVSLLTDLSSEMVFSVFAIFFTTFAGGSTALLGMVEGFADLSASSLNYLSGWLSDRTGKRKVFTLTGYGFSSLAKLMLLVTNSVLGLSLFRVIERLGKSFRGPPRDAWLSGVAQKSNRGLTFGIHKALDKTGAIIGPLLAYELLSRLGDNAASFKILFWVALVPAILSVVLLTTIKEKPGTAYQRENMMDAWKSMTPSFKRYLIPTAIFSLAYFSFGFLLLRAYTLGFSIKDIVLLYALFNTSCVIMAPLAGRFGDIIGRRQIIVLGYLLYSLICIGFAFATAHWHILVLFIIYGLFYAIDEAQSKAFISDIQLERRASAIGIYNGISGTLFLPASMIAGVLWLSHPAFAFLFATGLAWLAILSFLMLQANHAKD